MTRSFRISRPLLGAAIATAALLGATGANGAERVPTRDGIAVRYSPTELTSSAAAEHLYRNLQLAARAACGDGPTLRSLSERIQENRCVEKVLANAVHRINQPMLTSLHEAHSNKVG